MIKKICKVYSWKINETGKQGKGVQFTITIPKVSESGKENSYVPTNIERNHYEIRRIVKPRMD